MYNIRPAKLGESLTARERAIVELICEGHSNKIIADRIGISAHTVKFHVFRLCTKLGGNRTLCAVKWTRMKCETEMLRAVTQAKAEAVSPSA